MLVAKCMYGGIKTSFPTGDQTIGSYCPLLRYIELISEGHKTDVHPLLSLRSRDGSDGEGVRYSRK